ncbi:hypothetical protein BJ944DRAFT_247057 [Cunninghamella echinulata]|nr:hypothetical protein BJ944DRAFT_247057 [Cunninghamella echinulata]
MKGKSPQFNGITNEARWYIIGAYLANGGINEIASHLNLSENTIQTVINNFKSTGVPSYRRKKGNLTSTTHKTNKSLEQQNRKESNSSAPIVICKKNYKKSKDINHNLNKDTSFIHDSISSTITENNIKSISTSFNKNSRRRSNPTSDIFLSRLLNSCRIYETKRYELWRNEQSKKIINQKEFDPSYLSTATRNSSPLIPTSHEEEEKKRIEKQPNPLTIITTTTTTASASDLSIHYHGIYSNDFIAWTIKDDKLLLGHVFYFDRTFKKWDVLEQIYEGRHTADDCKERWFALAPLVMNEMKNINDPESITPW